ncbi:MAG: hypothetical protein WKG00_21705, partial [Polyangiaceae bacterium]
YDADTPWAWATQHMTAQPFPFETIAIAANVPPKMRGAVLRALSKEPAQRQQTAREFYEDLSIGTTRLSYVGGAPRGPSASFSGGAPSAGAGFATGPLPSRGGQTQVGEPIFPGGVPGGMGAPPAQHTMVDAPAMGPSAGAVPTGGGQAVPAMPAYTASGPKKGGMGAILGIGGVAVIGLIIGGVFLFRGGGKDDDDGAKPISIDAGPASSFTADPVPPAVDAGEAQTTPDAGGKVASNPTGGGPTGGGTSGGATSGGSTSGGSSDPKADAACDATVSLSLGNNVGMAASQFRSCKGPKRDKALAALDSASVRKSREGCRAKAELKQAASVGASSGFNALPKSCK